MAIPNQTVRTHHIGDVIEDIPMGMRAEDFPFIAEMFNNLYSDPILAVEREYATNALDSHIAAGNPNPIEITLPTADNLHFTVQDYGLGLSVDDLRNVYAMYGRSLKRGDNSVAGQLGMGCKSGLGYATKFIITAVKGGVKTSAVSTKDERGVGILKILDTMSTNEPNGVQIKIPVGRWDVDSFKHTARDLFQFWDEGTVLIDGEAPETPEWLATSLRLDDHTWLVRNDVGLYSSYVVMGNVPYPVSDIQIGRESRRFVTKVNMGDVDFVPSREAVHHTPHTNTTLSEFKDYVGATVKRAIATALDNAATRWDETMLRALWMDRNLVITSDADRPIWHYDPHGYGRAKAKSQFRYRIDHLAQPKVVAITGFPMKGLSTPARERLGEFFEGERLSYVLFPTGTTGVGMLDGRPNTYTWDEIVGATNAPTVNGVRVKRPKIETVYRTNNGGMTAAELAEVDGKVLYLEPGGSSNYGSLDATVISLYSVAQLPRIKRFVPSIDSYYIEVERRREAATKAITRQDRLIVQSRTLQGFLKSLDPDMVADPELASFIRLNREADTDTIKEAQTFSVPIPVENLSKRFNERYPLFAVGYYNQSHFGQSEMRDDVLLYVNAKFNAPLTVPKAVAS